MKTVLVDAGPLYALVDPDDQFHQRAYSDLERLTGAQLVVTASWSTVTEAYTLVLRRLSTRTAQRWLKEVVDGIGLLNPRHEDYLDAMHRLQRYADQDISLSDAVLAVLSDQLSIPVWTFDHHFDVMRTTVWR